MTALRTSPHSLAPRPISRLVRIGAALVVAAVLAACQADELGYGYGPKDQRPVSRPTQALMAKLDMKLGAPVLMRIFKEESTFEVWKMNASGRYALLKSYEICRWSGNLGPKVKEGDRQAPEGFYPISPGLMNPKSDWYLAFNTGFPNAYDRANERTGTALMVHGSCSSRGCYAMTDPQIQEIYALAREAFRGGQKAFQLQAFPFRLTAENMARHWKDPYMPFWKMLKAGYDTFEMTHLEPKVDVCGRQYVFNANPATPLSPIDACPADLGQPPELVASLAARAKADDAQAEVLFAKLEEERKVEEDKQIQLALAQQRQKADEEKRLAEAEARRIEAERNPGAIAKLLGAEPNPDAGIKIGPVVVPATGAPVPLADPRGPHVSAVALAEPTPPPAQPSALSRLFSFATGDDQRVEIPPATAATSLPAAGAIAPAAGAIAPAAMSMPAPTIGTPAVAGAIAVAPTGPAAPLPPPTPDQPATALKLPPPIVRPPAVCAAPGVAAPPGAPACAPVAVTDPVEQKDKSILERIGSWF